MARYRLSLRAILAILVLTAFGFGYFERTVIAPMRLDAERMRLEDAFLAANRAAGGWRDRYLKIHFGPEVDDKWLEMHVAPIAPFFSKLDNSIYRLFNDCQLGDTRITKAGLGYLPRHIISLDISSIRFGDDDVDLLAPFPELRNLQIGNTNITVSGLRRLAEVNPRLWSLGIDALTIDDISVLLHFPDLEQLTMQGCVVKGGSSVAVIARLPKLRFIWLSCEPNLAPPGLDDLRTARPDITITCITPPTQH